MPTIKLVSDLHFVHHPIPDTLLESLYDQEIDVLVVAGDIVNGLSNYGLGYLDKLANLFPNVIVVLGNHDFFTLHPNVTLAACSKFAQQYDNVYLLENNVVEVVGVEFVGATLWYPRPIKTSLYTFSDFVYIPGADPWIFTQNKISVDFLNAKVHKDSIVITHHMPSGKSTPPQYEGSRINDFYMCNMEDLIVRKQPQLWLHGHTHTACDYNIGNTRVVCNPYGYYGLEDDTGFNKDLQITI